MRFKPFLSRLDDYKTKSRKKIVLTALLFFAATRVISSIAVGLLIQLYNELGIDAMTQLNFMGNLNSDVMTEAISRNGLVKMVISVMIFAPLLEECAFRLGLSFKRWHMAVGLGALALFLFSRICSSWLWATPPAAIVGAMIWFRTTDGYWNAMRERWLPLAARLSAILFGLAHLFAMKGLCLTLMPLALMMCLMLFFAGATFVYLRVNLGFGWGLAAHIINNIPPVMVLISASLQ